MFAKVNNKTWRITSQSAEEQRIESKGDGKEVNLYKGKIVQKGRVKSVVNKGVKAFQVKFHHNDESIA